jgi:type 1 glutamine amidotransferase
VAQRFAGILEGAGFSVALSDTVECLSSPEALSELDLLVPCWSMGTLPKGYSGHVARAVGAGVGVAGCHGGMCDAFRADTEWQFITGGQWVSHPGGDGTPHTVNITAKSNPLVAGIEDFTLSSEHYYLHIDPAVEVLATTRFPVATYYHTANRPVDMPVVWTKMWGLGRVFYSSLGHHNDVFDKTPEALEIMRRGLLWAAGGKAYAAEHGLTADRYLNEAKMY